VDLPDVQDLGKQNQISADSREEVKAFLEALWTAKDQRLSQG